jgi:hypothetical protein
VRKRGTYGREWWYVRKCYAYGRYFPDMSAFRMICAKCAYLRALFCFYVRTPPPILLYARTANPRAITDRRHRGRQQ